MIGWGGCIAKEQYSGVAARDVPHGIETKTQKTGGLTNKVETSLGAQ